MTKKKFDNNLVANFEKLIVDNNAAILATLNFILDIVFYNPNTKERKDVIGKCEPFKDQCLCTNSKLPANTNDCFEAGCISSCGLVETPIGKIRLSVPLVKGLRNLSIENIWTVRIPRGFRLFITLKTSSLIPYVFADDATHQYYDSWGNVTIPETTTIGIDFRGNSADYCDTSVVSADTKNLWVQFSDPISIIVAGLFDVNITSKIRSALIKAFPIIYSALEININSTLFQTLYTQHLSGLGVDESLLTKSNYNINDIITLIAKANGTINAPFYTVSDYCMDVNVKNRTLSEPETTFVSGNWQNCKPTDSKVTAFAYNTDTKMCSQTTSANPKLKLSFNSFATKLDDPNRSKKLLHNVDLGNFDNYRDCYDEAERQPNLVGASWIAKKNDSNGICTGLRQGFTPQYVSCPDGYNCHNWVRNNICGQGSHECRNQDPGTKECKSKSCICPDDREGIRCRYRKCPEDANSNEFERLGFECVQKKPCWIAEDKWNVNDCGNFHCALKKGHVNKENKYFYHEICGNCPESGGIDDSFCCIYAQAKHVPKNMWYADNGGLTKCNTDDSDGCTAGQKWVKEDSCASQGYIYTGCGWSGQTKGIRYYPPSSIDPSQCN